ncbi:hypothetical protein HYALB_00009152 [Hymenoscyphus albidus]|uniref:2,5-diamino-6-ribosylamino-4(3H)-pyrimidinone 5'-phosphate reductase n=1 Tax=Hymenoscyphus albidus TaxID=595503 RepID=A0A9N9Q3E9_9HELO|nr:hypothetical protein HYALB_00009152 [Hymenoscyphus albidus]
MARDMLQFPSEHRAFLEPHLPPRDLPPISNSLPFTTVTFATSLDSQLALSPGAPTQLSGPQSKAMTHYLRSRYDAILIGVGTAAADNPSLNCRIEGVGGYGGEGLDGQPRPIVIDPSARWDFIANHKIFRLARDGRGRAPYIITGEASPPVDKKAILEEAGGEYITVDMPNTGANGHKMDWRDILNALSAKGLRSVMIEGGGSVINSLLQPEYFSIINSVIVTIAPTWLGTGGVVVSPPRRFNGEGNPMAAVRLDHVQWNPLGEDVVLSITCTTSLLAFDIPTNPLIFTPVDFCFQNDGATHIPGPKLAALTWWYEFYFDGIKGGKYVFKIQELHTQYGPIIRVTPDEIHVNDVGFLDDVYAPSTVRRDKYSYQSKSLRVPGGVGATAGFDLHKKRRDALTPFLSKRNVTFLEPLITKKVNQLCDVIQKHADTSTPVNLSDVFFAFSNDVVVNFLFAHEVNLLADIELAAKQRRNSNELLLGINMNKHFPWIPDFLEALPLFISKPIMPPGLIDMLDLFDRVRAELLEIIKNKASSTPGEKSNGPTGK